MKKILAPLLMLFTVFASHEVEGQSEMSHYVVIGAFAKQDNAIRYTDQANKNNFNALYAINPARQLYYVYILESPERKKAFSFMLKIRVETAYKDAWVFSGKLGLEEEPVVQVKPEPVKEELPPAAEPPVIETPVDEPTVMEKPTAPETEPKPEGKPFYFKLLSKDAEVLGEVQILESSGASQYQAFDGNKVVYLKAPKNTEGAFIASIQAPGYRPVEITVDYDNPSLVASGVGSENETIIPIELVRSKRGDYIEFNKVRFYGNSAIFDPQSKIELDGLVDLMKQEPGYKIRVHGHCNGKQSRNIVIKGKSNEFFETSTLNDRKMASAKEFTQDRADLVKEYLVSQGISAKRIKTKAEGGKVMIYPQNSTLAGYNDRIEIEIKKGK